MFRESDKLHTHLTIGLRPEGECPGCDQVWSVFSPMLVLAS